MGCTDLLGLFRFLSVHSIPVGPANQSGRRAATPPGPQPAATSLPSQQTLADSGSPTRLPWPQPGRTGGREII